LYILHFTNTENPYHTKLSWQIGGRTSNRFTYV